MREDHSSLVGMALIVMGLLLSVGMMLGLVILVAEAVDKVLRGLGI